MKELELKSNEAKLIELNLKYDQVIQLQTKTEKEKQEKLKKIEQLETERKRLERELQAKLDRKAEEQQKLATAAKKASGVGSVSASTYKPSGNKQSWLAASGIPQKYWWAVDSIVSGESGWNPTAYNSSSGACGLGQQLPCGKWAGDWKDPVAALKGMNGYVNKYGGWAGAVQFRNCVGRCVNPKTGQVVPKDHTWY